jgi:rare lipoprotein A
VRPHRRVRAIAAAAALGALSTMTFMTAGAPAAPTGAASATARVTDLTVAGRRLNVVAGHGAMVRGRIAPAGPGQTVSLQRRTGKGWRTIDRARTRGDGAFRMRFRPRQTGSAALRLRSGAAREHVGRLNVYRRAMASWYGPGLYGRRLGCGGTLTPGTLGVAHKSLPCGTRVTLRNGGRVLRVRVIDRGPYVGGREFDLTAATRRRLGFSGTGTILVAH